MVLPEYLASGEFALPCSFTRRGKRLIFSLALSLLFPPAGSADANCERIISLSPSITEILYELGLGDEIVGVTSYDLFPEEVHEKKRIGGLLDINMEAIVRLQPGVVFGVVEYGAKLERLKSLGLQVKAVDHRSLSGIFHSVETLGERCHREKEAEALRTKLKKAMTSVQKQVCRPNPPVRVLVAVGGSVKDTSWRTFHLSGSDGFFSDLLAALGAKNVHDEKTIALPMMSLEGVASLQPDIIFDIVSGDGTERERESRRDSWLRMDVLSAVREGHVRVINEPYAVIPGPRFPLLLKDFAQGINRYCKSKEL